MIYKLSLTHTLSLSFSLVLSSLVPDFPGFLGCSFHVICKNSENNFLKYFFLLAVSYFGYAITCLLGHLILPGCVYFHFLSLCFSLPSSY